MAETDWESLAATISQTILLIVLYLLRKYWNPNVQTMDSGGAGAHQLDADVDRSPNGQNHGLGGAGAQ